MLLFSFYYVLFSIAFGQDPGDGGDYWTHDLEAP